MLNAPLETHVTFNLQSRVSQQTDILLNNCREAVENDVFKGKLDPVMTKFGIAS
jgi:hypothetical protein